MNYIYASKEVYIALAIMSIFIFGLLLFRKVVRPPKGLIIASFISYVLVLINILNRSFDLQIPDTLMDPCFLIVMWPSYNVIACILALFWEGPAYLLTEGWSGGLGYIIHREFWGDMVVNLLAFGVNTLFIFAIIRLILYIKHKVSAENPQAK